MSGLRHSNNGFTLVEILLVLALLGLIGTMMPYVLDRVYLKNKHQALIEAMLASVQKCSTNAQRYQRSLSLDSSLCPLSESLKKVLDTELMPVFYADGTASQASYLRLVYADLGKTQIVDITIDKLTSRAIAHPYAQAQ